MRFAIVSSMTLKVVNVCEWEGGEWLPPFGTFVVQTDTGAIGGTYDPVSNSFSDPEEVAGTPVEDPV